MAGRIHRVGDPNEALGVITFSPQSSVYLDGRLVAVEGAFGTPDRECDDGDRHCYWVCVAPPSRRFFIEGKRVICEGDRDSCGHKRAKITSSGGTS